MYMCVQYDCRPLVLCALPVSVLAYESRHASEYTYVHTSTLFCLVHVHTHAIASVRKFTILGTLWNFPLSPWDTMDLFTDMPSLVSTKVCWGPGRAEQSLGASVGSRNIVEISRLSPRREEPAEEGWGRVKL